MTEVEIDFPINDADNHMYEPPEAFTRSRYSRCSGVRAVCKASSVIPMIAFIGVRIS